MAEELNVDPAALRNLADAHRKMATFYRGIATPDMDSVASMSLFLPAARDRAREYLLHHRPAKWNSVADMHDNIAGVHDLNAPAYEDGDIASADHVAQHGEDL